MDESGTHEGSEVLCVGAYIGVTRVNLRNLTTEQLVKRFEEITLAQNEALLDDQLAKFSRLFEQMRAVLEELKSRDGDQRRALVPLYKHPNAQVRLKAAKNTLAVAPKEALKIIQAIANSREYPQAGEAGMCLWNLERGVFKPT
jgi:ParB-like chromosome segregation protein Spo0J